MKGILGLLHPTPKAEPSEEKLDSAMFTTAFADQGLDPTLLVPWEARAVEIGAERLSPSVGIKLLQDLWSQDRYMHRLDGNAIARLERFFDFATAQSGRDIIRQDEYGNFMIVLLSGNIAVDRIQPWGERLRLAEVAPGEVLGEMSLLDSGRRFSVCTTLNDCRIAVLDARAMDEMLSVEPSLAASLIALLARKLSLRLRVVSARISDRK